MCALMTHSRNLHPPNLYGKLEKQLLSQVNRKSQVDEMTPIVNLIPGSDIR